MTIENDQSKNHDKKANSKINIDSVDIESLKTPREIENYIRALDEKYEKTQEVINDKNIQIRKIFDQLKKKIAELKEQFKDNEKRIKQLDVIEKDVADLEKDLDDLNGKFSVDLVEGKDGKGEKGTFKGKGSDRYLPEEEKIEMKETRAKYGYEKDKFKSPKAYLEFLAKELDSVEKINIFLKYLYRYSQEKDSGNNQKHVNQGESTNDKWLLPQDFAVNYNEEGRFMGDCEDIAILFEHILNLQGKKAFFFVVPGHALTGWIEKKDGKSVASVIDTTNKDGDTNTQASCQSLVGKDNESDEKLFSRLINSFSGKSDMTEHFSPGQMGLGFIFDDGRTFNVAANFHLAQKYEQIKAILEKNDFPAMIKILDEAIKDDPNNINLRLSKLQFSILCHISKEEVVKQTDFISTFINAEQLDPQGVERMNATAYFLIEKGFQEEAVKLFEKMTNFLNKKEFDINLNDTLSDVYVAANQYEKAYLNDKKIFEYIEKLKSEKPKDVEELASFITMMKERVQKNEKYKTYVLGQPDLPEKFKKEIVEAKLD